jgi:hypothetical protein
VLAGPLVDEAQHHLAAALTGYQVHARYAPAPPGCSVCAMSAGSPLLAHYHAGAAPMSIEELESGLSRLHHKQEENIGFWIENIIVFRRTLLFAIGETSELLAASNMSSNSGIELQGELGRLRSYLAIADDFLRLRILDAHGRQHVIN